MRIKIFTFGCKVNQYDSQFYKEFLTHCDNSIVDVHYDVALVNTCCVTKKAEKEAKRLIRKILNQGKEVWVTGCLVEKEELFSIFPAIKVLKRGYLYQKGISSGIDRIKEFQGHTRAFVKIVDGCENFCSYCIVPFVRGRISSRMKDQIISEIQGLVKNSYKEIVLTGIDIGRFGKDTGESFADLIKEINSIDGLQRFRLSSIEVFHISEQLLDVLAVCNKFCPSFHIPLQSGSDRILELMKRPYTFDLYIKKIERIKTYFPLVTFTTDIMIGFPGETEKDFNLTLSSISECKFLKVHLFPFSLHQQTAAAMLPGRVQESIKKERLNRASMIAQKVSLEVRKSFIRKRMKVLIEENIEGLWSGYSEYYIPVIIESSTVSAGEIVEIEPEEILQIQGDTYLFARKSII